MRLFFISLCLLSVSVGAKSLPEGPHLLTTGFAEVRVEPNMAVIEVNAEAINPDGLKAKQALDHRVEQFIVAANKLGLVNTQIVAQTLYTQPEYEYPEKGKPVLVGYKASRQLTLSLTELDKLSQLLDLVLQHQLQQVNSVRFMLQDNAAIAMQARKLAINDAKEKAAMLAQSFGATLGTVYQINYQQRHVMPVVRAEAMMLKDSGSNGGYLRDELSVRDEVEVIFMLDIKQ